MRKAEAKQVFQGRNGDDLYDAYGPSKLGDKIVWEGFVKDADDEWQARYILINSDKSYEIYEDFQAFMLEVGDLYDGLELKRLRERMMVVMPAVALLVAIGICAYLVIFKENYSAWAAAFMFFSIIASACVLYFGTYSQPIPVSSADADKTVRKVSPFFALSRNHKFSYATTAKFAINALLVWVSTEPRATLFPTSMIWESLR